jgi:hypothetical protein
MLEFAGSLSEPPPIPSCSESPASGTWSCLCYFTTLAMVKHRVATGVAFPFRTVQELQRGYQTLNSGTVRSTVASHPTSRLYLAQRHTRVRLPVPELLASHDIIFVLCSLCYIIGSWVDNAQSFFSSYCRLPLSNRVATLRFGPGSKGALPVGFIANASFRAEDF